MLQVVGGSRLGGWLLGAHSHSHSLLCLSAPCCPPGVQNFIKDTDGKGKSFTHRSSSGGAGKFFFWLFFLGAIGGGLAFAWTKLDPFTRDQISGGAKSVWETTVSKVKEGAEKINTSLLGNAPRSDGREHFVPLSGDPEQQQQPGLQMDPEDIREARDWRTPAN